VNVDTFTKKTSFMSLDSDALRLAAPHMIALAHAEGLCGHADAVRARIGSEFAIEPPTGGGDA
jgi:histidinol dehydrogenase